MPSAPGTPSGCRSSLDEHFTLAGLGGTQYIYSRAALHDDSPSSTIRMSDAIAGAIVGGFIGFTSALAVSSISILWTHRHDRFPGFPVLNRPNAEYSTSRERCISLSVESQAFRLDTNGNYIATFPLRLSLLLKVISRCCTAI